MQLTQVAKEEATQHLAAKEVKIAKAKGKADTLGALKFVLDISEIQKLNKPQVIKQISKHQVEKKDLDIPTKK